MIGENSRTATGIKNCNLILIDLKIKKNAYPSKIRFKYPKIIITLKFIFPDISLMVKLAKREKNMRWSFCCSNNAEKICEGLAMIWFSEYNNDSSSLYGTLRAWTKIKTPKETNGINIIAVENNRDKKMDDLKAKKYKITRPIKLEHLQITKKTNYNHIFCILKQSNVIIW